MGFDETRFKSQVKTQLLCSICWDVLREPLETVSCQHIFCKECIVDWIEWNPTCPIDRQELPDASGLKAVPFIVNSLIGELEIRCDFASKGCQLIIPLDQLPNHVKSCPSNPDLVKDCERGCGNVLRRGHVDEEFPSKCCVSCWEAIAREQEIQNTSLVKHLEQVKTRLSQILASKRSRSEDRPTPVVFEEFKPNRVKEEETPKTPIALPPIAPQYSGAMSSLPHALIRTGAGQTFRIPLQVLRDKVIGERIVINGYPPSPGGTVLSTVASVVWISP